MNDQVGLGPVTGLGEPQQDMRVTKSGRTTGVTSGTIAGFLGEGVLMSYGGFSTVIRHVWHIDGAGVSRGGDSGSWYLSEDTHQAVGLHFAGYHSVDGDYALMLTMSRCSRAECRRRSRLRMNRRTRFAAPTACNLLERNAQQAHGHPRFIWHGGGVPVAAP
jgi:hypothetical protein